MGAAMVIGLFVSYYSALKISYAHRAPYTGCGGFLNQLSSFLVSPKTGTDWTNTGFMLFGSGFTIWLMWMRHVFVWWPLHPVGYMMLSAWASFKLWFSIFLGWSFQICHRQIRRTWCVSASSPCVSGIGARRDDLCRALGNHRDGNRNKHRVSHNAGLNQETSDFTRPMNWCLFSLLSCALSPYTLLKELLRK